MMIDIPMRLGLFLTAATTLLLLAASPRAAEKPQAASAETLLANLEKTSGGRLGVYALNTADGAEVRYRADEHFPMCSTFKLILAAAILEKSTRRAGLLEERVHFAKSDLVSHSPISEQHLNDGMTIAELCAAVMKYSDNTAANLLIKNLGGPSDVTAYARSIGNTEFRLDRWETAMSACVPGDLRDTVTPASMARSLQALVLGETLSPAHRKQMNDWLRENTTGAKRIRAGIPSDWQAGDKTGTGDYGTANDIAVLWPPGRKPIVLAIYHTQKEADAKSNDEIIAATARIMVNAFAAAPNDQKN